MIELKQNEFTGFFVWGDGTSKQGRLILDFKDGYTLFRVWEVGNQDDSGFCYYLTLFLGKTLICPICEGDLNAPICKKSYKELHEPNCTISFENALKVFKSSNPDLTKNWTDDDHPYWSLENVMAELTNYIISPKSKYFKNWKKEIDKTQQKTQRKYNYECDKKFFETMEKIDPDFANY